MDYMISQGISASRLSFKGYGPDKPVASNSTAAGRGENRRVEFNRVNFTPESESPNAQ
jgi:OmpA-OmpF porin, OOP family